MRSSTRYHFRVSPPGQCLKLRILETDRGGPLLAATFIVLRQRLTTVALLRAFFALPLVTLKIVVAIHLGGVATVAEGRAPRSTPTCRSCEPPRNIQYQLGDRQMRRL